MVIITTRDTHRLATYSEKELGIAGHGGVPVIPALGKLGQEEYKFEVDLGYVVS
jgi:hypothetical protein